MVVKTRDRSDVYAGRGFGCAGDIDLPVCTAVSEEFQSVSVVEAISTLKYGIGSDKTGVDYGYMESCNKHLENSKKLIEYINRTRIL